MSFLADLIPPKWANLLGPELGKEYFRELEKDLKKEYSKAVIYPSQELIFRSLEAVSPKRVRVVVMGDEPYEGPGEAGGLAFGVPDTKFPKPPTLLNIYKEVETDLGCQIPRGLSSLEGWAQQGVLLLNAVLTVEKGEPGSHADAGGWPRLTNALVRGLQSKSALVYMLWGRRAQAKARLVNNGGHLVLQSKHPSPFSAYSGFFGCRHFSRANGYLMDAGLEPIDWTRISKV